ncbi:MAG: hypothetical protein FJ320_01750 [SAR202 cluster bacterium]|nr:hypothetical protein [SAR202 cluster bacterium]
MTSDILSAASNAAQQVIEAHPDTVQAWADNQPGAWGKLAGLAVADCRRRLNRPLTDDERRLVWHMLWTRLVMLKSSHRERSPSKQEQP